MPSESCFQNRRSRAKGTRPRVDPAVLLGSMPNNLKSEATLFSEFMHFPHPAKLRPQPKLMRSAHHLRRNISSGGRHIALQIAQSFAVTLTRNAPGRLRRLLPTPSRHDLGHDRARRDQCQQEIHTDRRNHRQKGAAQNDGQIPRQTAKQKDIAQILPAA